MSSTPTCSLMTELLSPIGVKTSLLNDSIVNCQLLEGQMKCWTSTLPASPRLRWRPLPHLQPQRREDQGDGQHLPQVLQGAAGAWRGWGTQRERGRGGGGERERETTATYLNSVVDKLTNSGPLKDGASKRTLMNLLLLYCSSESSLVIWSTWCT